MTHKTAKINFVNSGPWIQYAVLVSFEAHRQNITMLRSNIIFCDICCFKSASLRMLSLKRDVNCKVFTIIFAVFLYDLVSAYQISSELRTGPFTVKL